MTKVEEDIAADEDPLIAEGQSAQAHAPRISSFQQSIPPRLGVDTLPKSSARHAWVLQGVEDLPAGRGVKPRVRVLEQQGIWIHIGHDHYVSSHYLSESLPDQPNDPELKVLAEKPEQQPAETTEQQMVTEEQPQNVVESERKTRNWLNFTR